MFSSFTATNVNTCLNEGTYVDAFKKPKFDQFTKKMEEQKNQTIGPLASFPMFQTFMKDACMIKFVLILIKYFQGIGEVFAKVLAHIISF